MRHNNIHNRMIERAAAHCKAGFSLVELSVILIVIALLVGGVMTFGGKWETAETQKTISKQVKTAENAIHDFVRLNNRLPCPADPSLSEGHADFGKEMRNGSGTGCDASALDTTAGTDGQVAMGFLPVKVLGLTDMQAKDAAGNFKRYLVDERMTVEDAMIIHEDPDAIGNIEILDASGNTRTDRAIYALLSYGQKADMASPSTLEATNVNTDNVLRQASRAADFDDEVVFSTRRQLFFDSSSYLDDGGGGGTTIGGNVTRKYDWVIGPWGACDVDPEWSDWSAWSACSTTSSWSSWGSWGACSASPYWGSYGACSASPYWGSYGTCSGSCSCSWGSAYKAYTSGDTLAYYGGSCPSCPAGYVRSCSTWFEQYGRLNNTRNWRSCGSWSGGSGSGYCCFDRYQRDQICSGGSGTQYRTCYGTSGTQYRTCYNTSGTQYRYRTCNRPTGTQSRTRTCTRPTGTQTRSVTCENSDGVVVADSFCEHTAKPATSQSCTADPCVGSDTETRNCTPPACSGSNTDSRSCSVYCSGSSSRSCTSYCSGSSSRSCTPSC